MTLENTLEKGVAKVSNILKKLGKKRSKESEYFEISSTLKLYSRRLTSAANKAAATKASNACKVKEALKNGRYKEAKEYAGNVIYFEKQIYNYNTLCAKIETIRERVRSIQTIEMFSGTMGEVVKALDSALGGIKIADTIRVLNKFETQCENADIIAESITVTMNDINSTSVSEDKINDLMAQMMDEDNIQFNSTLGGIGGMENEEIKDEVQKSLDKRQSVKVNSS